MYPCTVLLYHISERKQRETDIFSAENQEVFYHVDEENSRNRWKRMETVGFFACFEIGLDGGKEYL